MSTFRILFSKNDLARFAFLLIVMMGGSLLELVSLGAVPCFVGLFTAPAQSVPVARVLERLLTACQLPAPQNIVAWSGAILAGLFLVRTLYLVASYALQERVLANRHIAIASRLFNAYMNAPYAYHLSHNSATAVNNISNEVENIVRYVLDATLNLIRNSIVLVAILALLLFYDPVACIIAFAVLALAAGSFLIATRHRLNAIGTAVYAHKQELLKVLSEGLLAYKEAQLLDMKGTFCTRLHHVLQSICMANKSKNLIAKSTWPFMELITCAVILGCMTLMMLFYSDTSRVPQTIALIAVCLARMKGTITEIMIFEEYRKSYTSIFNAIAQDLQDLEMRFPPLDANAPLPELTLNRAIQFNGIQFQFENTDEPTLKNISFDVPAGTSLAIVGPTGSGKSTIANIAVALLAPTAGQLAVDGTPIASPAAVRAWQNMLGYVPQDIFLLDDSIRANVAFGLAENDIDNAAVEYAIAASQLDGFINTLPEGLDTQVGEHGIRLSGGQRQRIAIARALYRNPQCLVFDEATSALDVTTEQAITDAINKLKGKHTIIVIAHRLSTVRNCDSIIFVKDGTITGKGSYDQLQKTLPDFNQMTKA